MSDCGQWLLNANPRKHLFPLLPVFFQDCVNIAVDGGASAHAMLTPLRIKELREERNRHIILFADFMQNLIFKAAHTGPVVLGNW